MKIFSQKTKKFIAMSIIPKQNLILFLLFEEIFSVVENKFFFLKTNMNKTNLELSQAFYYFKNL